MSKIILRIIPTNKPALALFSLVKVKLLSGLIRLIIAWIKLKIIKPPTRIQIGIDTNEKPKAPNINLGK